MTIKGSVSEQTGFTLVKREVENGGTVEEGIKKLERTLHLTGGLPQEFKVRIHEEAKFYNWEGF